MIQTPRTLKTSRFASAPREINMERAINTPRSNINLNLPSVRHSTGTVTPRINLSGMLSRSQSIRLYADSVNGDDIVGSEVLKSMTFALNPQIYNRMKNKKGRTHRIIGNLKSQAADITLLNKNLVLLKKKKDSQAQNQNRSKSIGSLRPKLKQPRSVVGGTLSMMIANETKFPSLGHTHSKDQMFDTKSNFGEKSEKKNDTLRKSVISWLLEHQKEDVDKINGNHQAIISWIVYLQSLNKTEFDELLRAVGINQNSNLFARLFWLFDMNGDGVIDQKELLTVLEWFKENSFEERLKMFFDLADDDDKGYINEDKLFYLFKKNLRSEEDLRKLKQAVKALIDKEIRPVDRNLIKLNDLASACDRIDALKCIIESNVKYLKTKTAKQPLKMGLNHIMSKPSDISSDGFSYPYMQRLMSAIETKNRIDRDHKMMIQQHTRSMKQLKMNAGHEIEETEEM